MCSSKVFHVLPVTGLCILHQVFVLKTPFFMSDYCFRIVFGKFRHDFSVYWFWQGCHFSVSLTRFTCWRHAIEEVLQGKGEGLLFFFLPPEKVILCSLTDEMGYTHCWSLFVQQSPLPPPSHMGCWLKSGMFWMSLRRVYPIFSHFQFLPHPSARGTLNSIPLTPPTSTR